MPGNLRIKCESPTKTPCARSKDLAFCFTMFNFEKVVHISNKEDYMTQKELLYLEDAIGHEQNIISICQKTVTMLEDDNLIAFLENEIDSHTAMKEELINMLEGKANG